MTFEVTSVGLEISDYHVPLDADGKNVYATEDGIGKPLSH